MVVVGYIRLSRDEDKENYSSIESQQDIIKEYAKSCNWEVTRMYIDDNYSGYTFNRPAFNELREDLEAGNIDIILAKDLSRIGRHNAKTLLFIEEIQTNGKRILLPEEGRGYDSNADDDDILGIKTWYNERYVKDISRKIKANMFAKQKKGELVMGNLYGYLKDPFNKSKLFIDENIKTVIEIIFKLYLEGLGYKKICDILNEKGCPTPSAIIKQRHAVNGRVFKNAVSSRWQTHNIQRIIQNDLYIGILRTHKKQNKKVKGKQELVRKEEQFVFPDHHEPIISKEVFELAQQVNKKRRAAKYKGSAKYNYIFSSFVFCGDCGFAATGKNIGRYPGVRRGYECTRYSKYGRQGCVCHNVWEERLVFYFKEFLRDVRIQYKDYLNSLCLEDNKKNIFTTQTKLQKELNNVGEELKMLLNQKIKDLIKENKTEYQEIIENSYSQLEKEKKSKIEELSFRIEELNRISVRDIENKMKTAIAIFDTIIDAERPERKDLELILDKIFIYKDKSVEFKLLVDINELTYSNQSNVS